MAISRIFYNKPIYTALDDTRPPFREMYKIVPLHVLSMSIKDFYVLVAFRNLIQYCDFQIFASVLAASHN